tara:strand:+ start:1164 stop:1457 length:294 start_codon:yes stop_codon:yes gene_type:complete
MANPNAKGRKQKDSITISGEALNPFKIVDDGTTYKIFKGDKKSIDSYQTDFVVALEYIARKKLVMENSGTVFAPKEYVSLLDDKIEFLKSKYERFSR